jgi:hypothetical protein
MIIENEAMTDAVVIIISRRKLLDINNAVEDLTS